MVGSRHMQVLHANFLFPFVFPRPSSSQPSSYAGRGTLHLAWAAALWREREGERGSGWPHRLTHNTLRTSHRKEVVHQKSNIYSLIELRCQPRARPHRAGRSERTTVTIHVRIRYVLTCTHYWHCELSNLHTHIWVCGSHMRAWGSPSQFGTLTSMETASHLYTCGA